ncbi:phenol hydroxylase subunit [Acinetobacter zhairhuonensis]|uniref:phenol hydroxylase subunit n=1 Tax=Acinetobacter sp. A7.4 TaxID=2919921 RepID=UPI001F4E0216|nr:phenol hydroxylase subunit [Acinetobacter sp. A7.4]MCJ8160466.1 phenol hydroxylase subunit [Acinetobacter sp. A7.4]
MSQKPQPNPLTKYIRITGERDAKFIEFDFAIHDPTLFVELVLPKEAFQHFCEINQVVEMTNEQQAWNDAQEDKWRYGIEPTLLNPSQQ